MLFGKLSLGVAVRYRSPLAGCIRQACSFYVVFGTRTARHTLPNPEKFLPAAQKLLKPMPARALSVHGGLVPQSLPPCKQNQTSRPGLITRTVQWPTTLKFLECRGVPKVLHGEQRGISQSYFSAPGRDCIMGETHSFLERCTLVAAYPHGQDHRISNLLTNTHDRNLSARLRRLWQWSCVDAQQGIDLQS